MALSTFISLCNHHYYPHPGFFHLKCSYVWFLNWSPISFGLPDSTFYVRGNTIHAGWARWPRREIIHWRMSPLKAFSLPIREKQYQATKWQYYFKGGQSEPGWLPSEQLNTLLISTVPVNVKIGACYKDMALAETINFHICKYLLPTLGRNGH